MSDNQSLHLTAEKRGEWVLRYLKGEISMNLDSIDRFLKAVPKTYGEYIIYWTKVVYAKARRNINWWYDRDFVWADIEFNKKNRRERGVMVT